MYFQRNFIIYRIISLQLIIFNKLYIITDLVLSVVNIKLETNKIHHNLSTINI